jgi:hypothetical protein
MKTTASSRVALLVSLGLMACTVDRTTGAGSAWGSAGQWAAGGCGDYEPCGEGGSSASTAGVGTAGLGVGGFAVGGSISYAGTAGSVATGGFGATAGSVATGGFGVGGTASSVATGGFGATAGDVATGGFGAGGVATGGFGAGGSAGSVSTGGGPGDDCSGAVTQCFEAAEACCQTSPLGPCDAIATQCLVLKQECGAPPPPPITQCIELLISMPTSDVEAALNAAAAACESSSMSLTRVELLAIGVSASCCVVPQTGGTGGTGAGGTGSGSGGAAAGGEGAYGGSAGATTVINFCSQPAAGTGGSSGIAGAAGEGPAAAAAGAPF